MTSGPFTVVSRNSIGSDFQPLRTFETLEEAQEFTAKLFPFEAFDSLIEIMDASGNRWARTHKKWAQAKVFTS
jgi:hypothetical protein